MNQNVVRSRPFSYCVTMFMFIRFLVLKLKQDSTPPVTQKKKVIE